MFIRILEFLNRFTRLGIWMLIGAWILTPARSLMAQDTAQPTRIFGMTLTGSLRGRIEHWNWFSAPPAQNSYTYGAGILRLKLGQSWRRMEWQAEGAFPFYVNLPDSGVAPALQGPLGYGGDYFFANGQRNIGTAVLRQAFVGISGLNGQLKLRFGRLEFADGAEAVPPDADLAELKRDRINQRLIGTFNYALRSFDGAQLSYRKGRSEIAAMAARVVEGSFQVRALEEINVEVGYGSYTRYISVERFHNEVRLFGLYYQDGRGVLKTDNRPDVALAADRRRIRLVTPGADFISARGAGPGTADIVLWGAVQLGRWGAQKHLAGELAAEVGYRFRSTTQPWLRIGWSRSTGDQNPNDNHHSTFFQALSSPRAYARFPFYVLMNTDDRFLQFKLTPMRKLGLRSEFHSVRLSSVRDLWYDGGGPFQNETFGYLGRPSGGARKVGNSLDLSADLTLSPRTTVSFYGGVGLGSAVPAFTFPAGGNHSTVHLLSIEIIRRF